jgi:hypothetical protein
MLAFSRIGITMGRTPRDTFEFTPHRYPMCRIELSSRSGDEGDAEYAEAHVEWEHLVESSCRKMQCKNDGQLRFEIHAPWACLKRQAGP